MRTRTTIVRRKVNILKRPEPKFVSLVDYAATQQPFAAVKRLSGDPVMKTKPKKATSAAKKATAAPSVKSKAVAPTKAKKSTEPVDLSSGCAKITFDKTVFKSEEAVERWLAKNRWEGYEVDETKKSFIVTDPADDPENFSDTRIVEVAKGIKATVGKRIEEDDDEVEDADDDADDDAVEGARAKPLGKTSKAKAKAKKADDDGDGDGDEPDDDADEDTSDDADNDGDDDDPDSDDDADEDGEDSEDDESEDDDADGDDDEDDRDTSEEDEIDEEAGGVSDQDLKGNEELADELSDDVDDDGKPIPPNKKPNKLDGKSIDDREADEPDEDILPGQGPSARGPGADSRVAGRPGGVGALTGSGNSAKSVKAKPKAKKRLKLEHTVLKDVKGRTRIVRNCHSNPAIDGLIRKFDSYNVYLSGGKSLKDVLIDGMQDGVPPGTIEIMNGVYKSVGNVMKDDDPDLPSSINVIAKEFAETIIAVHETWKKLLSTGTKAQKAAAKAYFAEAADDLFTAATGTDTKALIDAAVAKAVKPFVRQADKGERTDELRRDVPMRKSLGTDDLLTPSKKRSKREEDEDDDRWMQDTQRKSLGAFV